MTAITKTSSSCLSYRILPCILWTYVRLPAESDINKEVNWI